VAGVFVVHVTLFYWTSMKWWLGQYVQIVLLAKKFVLIFVFVLHEVSSLTLSIIPQYTDAM
jgi:hypothetical protein